MSDQFTAQAREAARIPVLANDSGDLDVSTLAVTSQPQHGVAFVSGSEVRYVAQPGWTGTVDFTYVVCGLDGACSSAGVSVTVVRD